MEIPEPMDTDKIDPYIPKPKEIDKTDPYSNRKIESDLQKEDYFRSFNKDYKQVENTTRIFGNQTETIAANDIKFENLGDSSTQPIPYRIDDLNKRNVAQ
ncbi:hypothetical protein J1N35_007050 [Gossypium stocksii]|uniref:Uncharacterized protein n=1 Tax=Gossypium stocksii TaxID=47602 RepID=A0A9D3W6X5_9ROSI|nr:hypothetical protein J1N35_007050 [Gossypium stocksii]